MSFPGEPETQTQYGGIGEQPPGKIPPTKYTATCAPEPPGKGKSSEGVEKLQERIEKELSSSSIKKGIRGLGKKFNYVLEKFKLKKPDIPNYF
jgi:hypothetical protein